IQTRIITPVSGTVPATCFTSGTSVTMNFQASISLDQYQESYLEINYTVASAAVGTSFPLSHWFAQLAIFPILGPGTPLWLATPTMTLLNAMNFSPEQADRLLRDMLIDPATFGVLNGGTLPVGANQIIRLPLIGSWLEVVKPAM